jgi:hypothetical protein
LATVAIPLAAAEVYRSLDAEGNVAYSDRPEGTNPERVFIATQRPASSPRPAARPAAAATPAAAQQPEVLGGEVRVERPPQEIEAERQRNCAVARDRAERYKVSQRLYRTLPNGEREYLSDAELDEARAKADADVANWCG